MEGIVVKEGFRPNCRNCQHFNACADMPRHAEYPKNWYFRDLHNRVMFCDTELVFSFEIEYFCRNWGKTRAGCSCYEIAENERVEAKAFHLEYLRLLSELKRAKKAGKKVLNQRLYELQMENL